jgi:uncharacterized membrane protein YphA (DoxX/SURF4 family)
MMPRPSRLAGLFTSLFLVAFVLVTSGFACIAPANPQGMGAMGIQNPSVWGIAARAAEAPGPSASCRAAPANRVLWKSLAPCA